MVKIVLHLGMYNFCLENIENVFSISREAVMDHDEERRFRGWTAWAQILIMPLSVSQCPHLLILVNNIPYLVGLFGFR